MSSFPIVLGLLLYMLIVTAKALEHNVLADAPYPFDATDKLLRVASLPFLDHPLVLSKTDGKDKDMGVYVKSLPGRFSVPVYSAEGEFVGFAEVKMMTGREKVTVERGGGEQVKLSKDEKKKNNKKVEEKKVEKKVEKKEDKVEKKEEKKKEEKKEDQEEPQIRVLSPQEIQAFRSSPNTTHFYFTTIFDEQGPLGMSFAMETQKKKKKTGKDTQQQQQQTTSTTIPPPSTLMIERVEANSAAYKNGVREGDYVIAFNDHPEEEMGRMKPTTFLKLLLKEREEGDRSDLSFTILVRNEEVIVERERKRKEEEEGLESSSDQEQDGEGVCATEGSSWSHRKKYKHSSSSPSSSLLLSVIEPPLLAGFYPITLASWSNPALYQPCTYLELLFSFQQTESENNMPSLEDPFFCSFKRSEEDLSPAYTSISSKLKDFQEGKNNKDIPFAYGMPVAFRGSCNFLQKLKQLPVPLTQVPRSLTSPQMDHKHNSKNKDDQQEENGQGRVLGLMVVDDEASPPLTDIPLGKSFQKTMSFSTSPDQQALSVLGIVVNNDIGTLFTEAASLGMPVKGFLAQSNQDECGEGMEQELKERLFTKETLDALPLLTASLPFPSNKAPSSSDAGASKGEEEMKVRTGELLLANAIDTNTSFSFVRALYDSTQPSYQPFVAPIVIAEPANGCFPDQYEVRVSKSVVVAERGGCSFAQKALAVQTLGGVGLVVISNSEAVVPMMGEKQETDQVKIPSVMISKFDGLQIKDFIQNAKKTYVRFLDDEE